MPFRHFPGARHESARFSPDCPPKAKRDGGRHIATDIARILLDLIVAPADSAADHDKPSVAWKCHEVTM
jgi:hypothetical protein